MLGRKIPAISATMCLAAALFAVVPMELSAITPQPAVPYGEIGCYYFLGSAGGLARNISSDKRRSAQERKQAVEARASYNWYQQWYLARISTWPAERVDRKAAKRAFDMQGRETIRMVRTCMDWADAVNASVFKPSTGSK